MKQLAITSAGSQSGEEQELVERARRGDRRATHALYELHAVRVHRLMYRMSGDEERARDRTHNAFVRAFARLDRVRGESAFGTWMYRIALTVALNDRRRRQRTALRWAPMSEELPDETPRADPNLRARLREAIVVLPKRQRAVFLMHAFEGYTHVEIGEILGISEGTGTGICSMPATN